MGVTGLILLFVIIGTIVIDEYKGPEPEPVRPGSLFPGRIGVDKTPTLEQLLEQAKKDALELVPADPAAPIRMTSGPMIGPFWTAMTSSSSIARQRILAFPRVDVAFAYLKVDPEWKTGRQVITSITTRPDPSVGTATIFVVLSDNMKTGWSQWHTHSGDFPGDLLSMKQREGFRVTTVSRVGTSWWVAMARNTGLREQVVLGPVAEWPDADIEQYRGRGMFVTEIAHGDGQGFVVVMSSTDRIRRQVVYRGPAGSNQNDIAARYDEGFRYAQAISVSQIWYVVLTDRGRENATWLYNSRDIPRSEVLKLASQGYRIAWLR
jgi:hypothetical protein